MPDPYPSREGYASFQVYRTWFRVVGEGCARLAGSVAPDSAYHAALQAFQHRYLCRMDPWPGCLKRSLAGSRSDCGAHDALFGAGDFEPGGQLAGWTAVDRLADVPVPTLVVSGRFDRTTPAVAAAIYQGIPASEWVVFEQSANMTHLEEPNRFLEVLDGFLARADRVRG